MVFSEEEGRSWGQEDRFLGTADFKMALFLNPAIKMTQWEREKSETQQGNHLWEQTLPTQAPDFPLWSIFLCLQAFFPLKTSIRNKNWSRGFVCLSVHFFTLPLMKNKLMNEQINKNVFPWLLVEHHVASALELGSWVWISGVCKDGDILVMSLFS